jgi:hypothetical protein
MIHGCFVKRLLALLAVTVPCFAIGLIDTEPMQTTPALAATTRPTTPPQPQTYFPLGMFEAGGALAADQVRFGHVIDDLRAHNLDSIMFNNGSAYFHAGLLDVSDQKGFNVIFSPEVELYANWFFNATATESIEAARSVVNPLVALLRGHPSLRGYNILDDATTDKATKVALAVQAFWEADSSHPAAPIVVGAHEQVYTQADPWRFVTYYYPAKATKQPCDWGFTSPTANAYTQAIRSVSRDRDPGTPLWLLLQAHGVSTAVNPSAPSTQLRIPTPEEVRLQQWMALGEGATGTFWFIYSTQQFWTGLLDNPTLYNEVGAVSARVAPLRSTLLSLHKVDDRFTVSGSANRYISTLATWDESRQFVVVANGSCTQSQNLTVSATGLAGKLKDLETGRLYDLGAPIAYRPGDGRMFEVVNVQVVGPVPPRVTSQPNLIVNGSFEQFSGGVPTSWSGPAVARDTSTAHSGAASLRISGPASFSYLTQNLTLKPATMYTASYWVRTQNAGSGAQQGIGLRYAQLAVSSQVSNLFWTGGTSAWKQVSTTFYSGLDLTAGRVDLVWDVPSGGVAWVDDVVLCEGRVCGPAAPPGGTSTNQLLNPSFEQVDATGPLNWSGSGAAVVDSATAHTGSRSLRVTGAAPLAYRFQARTLKPGTRYTVSYWVKAQNAGTGSQGIGVRYSQLQTGGAVSNFPWVNGTTNWKQVTTTFVTQSTLSNGRLDVVWTLPAGATAWIDDIAVCEATACTP